MSQVDGDRPGAASGELTVKELLAHQLEASRKSTWIVALPSYLLALSSTVATLFLAFQAYLARTSYIEATENRFLEKKIEVCFDNFDTASKLDTALRITMPDISRQTEWPPRVIVNSPDDIMMIQIDVVPKLYALESGLTKAAALGGLDKYRAFLLQQIDGLAKEIADIEPRRAEDVGEDDELAAASAVLSDFLGAQYVVFTGCRLVAEGKA